ncbi:hypothetical protein SKAU_G00122100 [Synaphobranchus kaupii]|uniref:Uncharacterized protein n=1 Tax=Synaphobranchus kaupii TaxID=118154 RepID=A0A9Q1J1I7_SYNKA|nr:hypothetical protein SKAU_G00122100 [Synaphobranchus kaupii]
MESTTFLKLVCYSLVGHIADKHHGVAPQCTPKAPRSTRSSQRTQDHRGEPLRSRRFITDPAAVPGQDLPPQAVDRTQPARGPASADMTRLRRGPGIQGQRSPPRIADFGRRAETVDSNTWATAPPRGSLPLSCVSKDVREREERRHR